MEKETQPTAIQIDVLAQTYFEAQAEADRTQGVADIFRDQLITMAQEFGCIAPRSDKTRQIQGEQWIVKVTQGQSVQLNHAEVEKLRDFLLKKGRSRIFAKLFLVEQRYTLAEGASQLVSSDAQLFGNGRIQRSIMDTLRTMFARSVEFKTLSPRLKVEPIKKAKE